MKTHLSPSAFIQLHKHCQANYVYGTFEITEPMLIGSYVDAYFSGKLEDLQNGENSHLIFTNKGTLRSSFKMAEEIIEVIKSDKLFHEYIISGNLQYKVQGEIGGVEYLGFIDNFIEHKAIVDLKIVKSIREHIWNDLTKIKENFITSYGYDYQLAIYQDLIYQKTGELLPCYIAAVSKEKGYDREIIYIPDEVLHERLEEVKELSSYYLKIRQEKTIPFRCEKCKYCRSSKKLETPLHLYDL